MLPFQRDMERRLEYIFEICGCKAQSKTDSLNS